MNIIHAIQRLFSKRTQPQIIEHTLIESERGPLKEFSFLNTDERIKKIMIAGDTGKPEYFYLMQHALLNDQDINVKFAALKRIHLFAAHPGLLPMMKKLQETNPGNTLEPYFRWH